MSENLSITIIVLLYNDMPHGLNAIESVLSQSYQGFKLIIIDNGSTDDTWKQIQKYAGDPRITLHRNDKNIRSGAVQPFADTVKTQYLSFLFADDTYECGRLEHGILHLEKNPQHDYIFYRNSFYDENGRTLSYVPHYLFSDDISKLSRWQHLRHIFTSGNTLHPCGMIIRTKTYQRLGGFKNFLHKIGDMAFFVRLLANADGVFSPHRMQRITVWSCKRNESSSNGHNSNALIAERTFFLEEYMKPEMLYNMSRIFERNLPSDVDKLWTLATEAMRVNALDYQLFAIRLFYKAAEMADNEFEQKIIAQTGMSINSYIQHVIERMPSQQRAIRMRQFIKKIPGAIWLYSASKDMLEW